MPATVLNALALAGRIARGCLAARAPPLCPPAGSHQPERQGRDDYESDRLQRAGDHVVAEDVMRPFEGWFKCLVARVRFHGVTASQVAAS